MFYLAYRNLFQDKLRLMFSILGVVLAMALIVFLRGFLADIYIQLATYLNHTAPTWVVAQEGVENMLGATSLLPAGTDDRAQGVAGIEQITPIIAQYTILDIHNEKVAGYMVSHDQRIRDIADRVLWLEDEQFATMVDMALDPVCGMSIEITKAPAQTSIDGRTFLRMGLPG